MAIVIKRGNVFHIQWYDTITRKVCSKSTKLEVNKKNEKKALSYANKLQEELTTKTKSLKKIGVNYITIQDAFQHFLRNNQNKHIKTISEYHRFYSLFTDYFKEDMPCAAITKIDVENWLINIKSLNYKQNTIHTYGKQCIHFLNFLFEYNYLPMFKINREVKTKPEIGEKITMHDEDIKLIFQELDEKNSNFKTTIYLAFYTGLRSSDLLTITVERIDIENRILNYYSPKRKKFREIPFHSDLSEILELRMKEIKSGPLLHYSNIHNMGRAVERYFERLKLRPSKNKKLLDVTGITKSYSMRTFRKTFITLCRSRYDMDATIVRELVGHEHYNTTDRYYNQVSINAMKREFQKFKRPGT